MTYSFNVTCNGSEENEGHVGYKQCDLILEEMGMVLRKHGYELEDSFWEVER